MNCYYLREDFLITYEDYSFLRNIAIGIMHTHLLELFFCSVRGQIPPPVR